MKKLLAILMILSLMLCTLGCQASENPGADMNSESEIKKAYIAYLGPAWELSEDEIFIDSYGTYSSCTVGYIWSSDSIYTQALCGEKVGSYIFQYADSQKMLAYKDGQIKSMPEAYDLGWLDDEAVKQIYERHMQLHPGMYDLTPYSKAGTAKVYGTNESVIYEYHINYPKTYDLPAEDSQFAEDRVIICVYPFANAYEFTPEDFSELQGAVNVQCIAVETISSTSTDTRAEEPTRLLALTLKDGSRSTIIDAIRYLQLRYDIYYAQPDYVIGSN